MSTEDQNELDRLRAFLHSREMHPDYEYKTLTGARKCFDNDPPRDEKGGWERNTEMGREGEGWDRFEYHEEGYWRRKK